MNTGAKAQISRCPLRGPEGPLFHAAHAPGLDGILRLLFHAAQAPDFHDTDRRPFQGSLATSFHGAHQHAS
jgi:hypothetical protein